MGRPRKSLDEAHPKTKQRRLAKLNSQIVVAIEEILNQETDPDLVLLWKGHYGDSIFNQTIIEEADLEPKMTPQNSELLVANVAAFYQSLPATSTVRTSLITELFKNISPVQVVPFKLNHSPTQLGGFLFKYHREKGV